MSCAKTRHLWRMTSFAQLVSHQTKLISFESLSATPLLCSVGSEFGSKYAAISARECRVGGESWPINQQLRSCLI
jgi:hypothetical protein